MTKNVRICVFLTPDVFHDTLAYVKDHKIIHYTDSEAIYLALQNLLSSDALQRIEISALRETINKLRSVKNG